VEKTHTGKVTDACVSGVYHDDDNSCHRINETSTHELKKLKAESTPKKVIKSLLKTVIDHGLLEEKRWVRVQS
jgi:hypothetical protein